MGNPWAPPSDDFPAVAPDRRELAGLGARLAGVLVDWLCLVVAMLPSVAVIVSRGLDSPAEPDALLVAAGAIPLVLLVAAQWFLIATRGQSIGKIAMGTQIVLLDGSTVGFLHGVVLRNWVIAFAAGSCDVINLGWLLRLGNALSIFNEERRCIHDRIASTKVVTPPRF